MSVDLSGFDASKVDPFVEYKVIPAGDYLGAMVDSELKDTKDSTGKYINGKFQIADGPHKGHEVYEIFNLVNKSEKAVEIAQAKLSSLCRAVGVLQPKSTADLYGRPVVLKIVVEERSDKKGSYSNKIATFSAPGSSNPVLSNPGPANGVLPTQAQAAPAAGGAKPWLTKA